VSGTININHVKLVKDPDTVAAFVARVLAGGGPSPMEILEAHINENGPIEAIRMSRVTRRAQFYYGLARYRIRWSAGKKHIIFMATKAAGPDGKDAHEVMRMAEEKASALGLFNAGTMCPGKVGEEDAERILEWLYSRNEVDSQ